MKLDVVCFLCWFPWAHFRLSKVYNFLISGHKHKVWVFIFLNIFGICWFTPAFLETGPLCNIIMNMSCVFMYDIIVKKIYYASKSYHNKKKKIQIYVMNMTFISSREAKNVYFICGFSTHEI